MSSRTGVFTVLAVIFSRPKPASSTAVCWKSVRLLGGWDGWPAWRAYSKHSERHVEVFQSIMESSCRAAGSLDGEALITGGKRSLFWQSCYCSVARRVMWKKRKQCQKKLISQIKLSLLAVIINTVKYIILNYIYIYILYKSKFIYIEVAFCSTFFKLACNWLTLVWCHPAMPLQCNS